MIRPSYTCNVCFANNIAIATSIGFKTITPGSVADLPVPINQCDIHVCANCIQRIQRLIPKTVATPAAVSSNKNAIPHDEPVDYDLKNLNNSKEQDAPPRKQVEYHFSEMVGKVYFRTDEAFYKSLCAEDKCQVCEAFYWHHKSRQWISRKHCTCEALKLAERIAGMATK